MTNYDLYKKRISIFGKTARERQINNMKHDIIMDFSNDIACKDTLKNDEPFRIIIKKGDRDDEKKIRSFPNEYFTIGDIFYFANYYWIVIRLDVDNELYQSGTIKHCNYLFRWQNESLEIIERWASVTRPYAADLDRDKNLLSLKTEFIVMLHSDEETRKLRVGKRLMMFKDGTVPESFKISAGNNITDNISSVEEGLIRFNIIFDGFNQATDNEKLKIADYIIPKHTIKILPVKELIVGDSIQIQYTCYLNGDEFEINPKYETSNENIISINENGVMKALSEGTVEISVSYKNVVEKINVIAVNIFAINNRVLEIKGNNSIKLSLSTLYTGFVFNNGNKLQEKVTWRLDSLELDDDAISLSIIDDNQVRVFVSDDDRNCNKTFKLICESSMHDLTTEKEIIIAPFM